MMGSVASASTFKFGSPTAKKMKEVTLSDSVKIQNGDKTDSLKFQTAGLRQKKVAVFWASVYVAQVFSNSKLDFTSIAALRESIMKGMPMVLTLTFLRDVDAKKVMDGFKDNFKENDVKVDTTPYNKFLEAVQKTGEVKDKQTYFFSFAQDKEKMSLAFSIDGKEIYTLADGDAKTTESFLKLWFGKPADSGLEKLQAELLKP